MVVRRERCLIRKSGKGRWEQKVQSREKTPQREKKAISATKGNTVQIKRL